MLKKQILLTIVLAVTLCTMTAGFASAYDPSSTNDVNRDEGWAHVNQISVGIGEVELEFVQPRSFFSCFEYRTDGDTSQVINEEHFLEFYGVVDESEGLQQYPYDCLSTISSLTKIISAYEYVEVRMISGAEGDERFDWTRFDVLPVPSSEVEWKRIEGIIPSGSSNVGGIDGNSTPWSAKGGKAKVFLADVYKKDGFTLKHAAGDVEVDIKGLVRVAQGAGYDIGTAIDPATGQGMPIDVVLVCDLDGDNGGPNQVIVATGHLSPEGDFKFKGSVSLPDACTSNTDLALLVVQTISNRWIAYGAVRKVKP